MEDFKIEVFNNGLLDFDSVISIVTEKCQDEINELLKKYGKPITWEGKEDEPTISTNTEKVPILKISKIGFDTIIEFEDHGKQKYAWDMFELSVNDLVCLYNAVFNVINNL